MLAGLKGFLFKGKAKRLGVRFLCDYLMKVMTFSNPGNFKRYSEVFYRVYVPSVGSAQSRESVVVATNFGSLAITAANLYKHLEPEGEGDGYRFFLGLLVPITLSQSLLNAEEVCSFFSSEGGEGPRCLASKVIEELANKARSWCEDPKKEERLKKVVSSKEVLVPKIEIRSSASGREHAVHSDVKRTLPAVEFTECNLDVEVLGKEEGMWEVKGVMGVAIVPLTGSFKLSNGKMLLFREATRNVIQTYSELALATYLQAVRELLHEAIERLLGTSQSPEDNVRLLVDTSYGLNSATIAMFHAVTKSLPLIRYEILRHGTKEPEVLFYNSDPAIGLNPSNSLEQTAKNNISYYYVHRKAGSLKLVMEEVEDIILSDNAENSGGHETPHRKVLRGLYLLSLGLIPWGLYEVETASEISKHGDWGNVLEYETKEKEGEIEIRYKPASQQITPQLAQKEILGLWLAALTKESVSRLIESNGSGEQLAIKEIPLPECRSNVEGKDDAVRCYNIRELKRKIAESNSPKDVTQEWWVSFINEVIGAVAGVVFEYEADVWLKNPARSLRHLIPQEYIKKEVSSLNELINYVCPENEEMCCLPNKDVRLNEQEEIRHVIAHAGLTTVHPHVRFLLEKRDGRNYSLKWFCIMRSFPFDELKKKIQ